MFSLSDILLLCLLVFARCMLFFNRKELRVSKSAL